jgi:hypothetical protein
MNGAQRRPTTSATATAEPAPLCATTKNVVQRALERDGRAASACASLGGGRRGLGRARQDACASRTRREVARLAGDRRRRRPADGRTNDRDVELLPDNAATRTVFVRVERLDVHAAHGVERSSFRDREAARRRDVRQLAVLGAAHVLNGQLVPGAGDGRARDGRDHSEREQLCRCSHPSGQAVTSRTPTHELQQTAYATPSRLSRNRRTISEPSLGAVLQFCGERATWSAMDSRCLVGPGSLFVSLGPRAGALGLQRRLDGLLHGLSGVCLRELVPLVRDEVYAAQRVRLLVEHDAQGPGPRGARLRADVYLARRGRGPVDVKAPPSRACPSRAGGSSG